jgi:N-acetylneuraminic acid mutarotase
VPARRLVIFAVFIATACSAVRAQSGWQSLAPFPVSARDLIAVAAGKRLYIFAGQGSLETPLGLVYQFDPGTNVWIKKKPMPLPAHRVAMAEYNGKIYAFGGFKKPASGQVAWEAINNSWEYDPASDKWTALKPMPSTRGAASAVSVDGKIYVMGGAGVHPGTKNVPLLIAPDTTPNRSFDVVEEYDVSSDSWHARSTMPTPRNQFALAAANGKVYAIGGRMGSAFALFGSNTEVVEEYSPANDTWGSEKAKMSTPRASLSWGVYNGRICIIGGELTDARVSASFRTAEAYEPATNQWSVLPSVPVGRVPVTGGVIGDTFYLVSADDRYRLLTGESKQSEGSLFDALRLSVLR